MTELGISLVEIIRKSERIKNWREYPIPSKPYLIKIEGSRGKTKVVVSYAHVYDMYQIECYLEGRLIGQFNCTGQSYIYIQGGGPPESHRKAWKFYEQIFNRKL